MMERYFSPVFWQNAGTAASALGILLQIALIPLLMSPVQQGLFYSFIALLATQTFFELGLSHVAVKEIASHNAAVVSGIECGADQRGDRRMDLVKAVVGTKKMYRLIAFASAIFLIPVGFIYFRSLSGVDLGAWDMPWIAAALSSSFLMLVVGDQSVMEGRGLVLEAAKSRAVVAIFKQVGLIGSLVAGLGVWAIAVGAVSSLCAFYGLLTRGGTKLDKSDARMSMPEFLVWVKRNWTFNWKISVSAISGFFIFQYMTLIFGIFQGVAVAGRIGIAVQMANAPLWFAAPIVSTKRYSWIAMIENRNRRALDESWFRATRFACLFTALMSIGVFVALLLARSFPGICGENIIAKLPALLEIMLLLAVTMINQYVFSMAQYLRCHGEEPFYVISAVFALCMAAFLPIACSFGTIPALSLYLLLVILSAIVGKSVFDQFRKGFACRS